jgi:hypothetical protein
MSTQQPIVASAEQQQHKQTWNLKCEVGGLPPYSQKTSNSKWTTKQAMTTLLLEREGNRHNLTNNPCGYDIRLQIPIHIGTMVTEKHKVHLTRQHWRRCNPYMVEKGRCGGQGTLITPPPAYRLHGEQLWSKRLCGVRWRPKQRICRRRSGYGGCVEAQ